MQRLFRWWLDNPARGFLLCMLLAGLSAGASEPLAYACLALAFASVVQGLRVLWRRSPILAMLVGAGIPAFSTLIGAREHPEGSLVLLWFPAALATATELAVRAARRRQGLPEIAPAEAPAQSAPTRTPSRARGCLVGVALLALCGGYFSLAPRIAASAFKGQLRVGMSLGDVLVASFDTGRHLVFVRAAEGAPELNVFESTVRLAGESAVGESAVRALLGRKASEVRVDSLSFMFLSSIPVWSSIVVRFGPDGRVTAIEGPFDRAD